MTQRNGRLTERVSKGGKKRMETRIKETGDRDSGEVLLRIENAAGRCGGKEGSWAKQDHIGAQRTVPTPCVLL